MAATGRQDSNGVCTQPVLSAIQCCLLVLMLAACAGPSWRKTVQQAHFVPQVITGDPFQHQLFLNQRLNQLQNKNSGDVLHIYIEGDGLPWRTRTTVSMDPTPGTPVMLELMTVDASPALYLGRPCYFNLDDPHCSAEWWTHWRYSESVVSSLNRVIDQFASNYRGIGLFGHSGGGTLAMLLAERRTDVQWVVTLAGNLDIEAWAQHHEYSHLQGSLNPIHRPPLVPEVKQLHLIGGRDNVVTLAMLEPAVARQQSADLRVIPDFNHACCWQEIWPALLLELGD